jgi:hypothetical protein
MFPYTGQHVQGTVGRVSFYWPSTTQSVVVSGPAGTHDYIIFFSKTFASSSTRGGV